MVEAAHAIWPLDLGSRREDVREIGRLIPYAQGQSDSAEAHISGSEYFLSICGLSSFVFNSCSINYWSLLYFSDNQTVINIGDCSRVLPEEIELL